MEITVTVRKARKDFSIMGKKANTEEFRALQDASVYFRHRSEGGEVAVLSAGRDLSPALCIARQPLQQHSTPELCPGQGPTCGAICGVRAVHGRAPPAVPAQGPSARLPSAYKRAAAVQPLCCQPFSCDPRWAWEREVSSRWKAPIEAPLIFQEFSGFRLYKPRQEEEGGKRLQC